jgi:hypothetical protein
MPGYKGHLVGGAVMFSITVFALRSLHPSVPTLMEWCTCTMLGSLFPDIDTKSKGQRLFYLALCITLIVLAIQRNFKLVTALGIIGLLPVLVHHRGLFHRLWFVVSVPMLVAWFGSTCMPHCTRSFFFDALFFSLGAISHLWLDLGCRRMLRV